MVCKKSYYECYYKYVLVYYSIYLNVIYCKFWIDKLNVLYMF